MKCSSRPTGRELNPSAPVGPEKTPVEWPRTGLRLAGSIAAVMKVKPTAGHARDCRPMTESGPQRY